MRTTESQSTTETKLRRIAWLSARDKDKQFHSLLHHINESSLKECFYQLSANRAVGVDGIGKAEYAANLDANLKELVERMKRMAYRPGPVRRVLIPKEGKPKATRPLGISNFEDKIVQKMMQRILESIYEPVFLECSYGFRPGRGCHDAIRALYQHLYANEVQIVIDIDLAGYFDSIDHKHLLGFLRMKIRDKRFLRYVARMLKAGVLSEGELMVSDEGMPQGSICSPILANVFAHYVIDQWFEDVVKSHCTGKVELFRYADDSVICCQSERDARRVLKGLAKRLEKYGLKLNGEKTQLVSFSKKAYQQGVRQETFDFLGFTFYIGRSQKGFPIPKLKSDGKRLRVKLKRVRQWAQIVRRQHPLSEIWRMFCVKLEGHVRYYGVSYNIACVRNFLQAAIQILFKWLNRRSQRKSFDWEKSTQFMKLYPPPRARVCHRLF